MCFDELVDFLITFAFFMPITSLKLKSKASQSFRVAITSQPQLRQVIYAHERRFDYAEYCLFSFFLRIKMRFEVFFCANVVRYRFFNRICDTLTSETHDYPFQVTIHFTTINSSPV